LFANTDEECARHIELFANLGVPFANLDEPFANLDELFANLDEVFAK